MPVRVITGFIETIGRLLGSGMNHAELAEELLERADPLVIGNPETAATCALAHALLYVGAVLEDLSCIVAVPAGEGEE